MNRNRPADVIETKKIHSGRVSLRIDRFRMNNKVIEREIVEHSPSVGLVPIDRDVYVYLVMQYRHATGRRLLEIPAGKIESGESPKEAASRELAEEIGLAGDFSLLTTFYLAPGYDTELMYLFLCRNLRRVQRGKLDEDEDISVKKLRISTAVHKCLTGEITDCKTIAAILSYSTGKKDKSLYKS